MDSDVQPGRYVVAVSGGVDSMALLHVLQQQPGVELIVAHFDHGIREDSYKDRLLVEATAHAYNLPFTSVNGELGPAASEATGREARYAFLHQVRTAQRAQAIITAHHQDDLLETAILNLLRGTGRKGLTSLRSKGGVIRPLLHLTKQQLLDYATANGLRYREDSTNTDDTYRRNYIRHQVLPRLDATARQQLLGIIGRMQTLNDELDTQLINLIHQQPSPTTLDRRFFIALPHALAKEFLASWLRARGIASFDTKTLERLTVAAKTAAPGARVDVIGGARLHITNSTLALEYRER